MTNPWRPHERMFAPGKKGLDPRLFVGDKIIASFRNSVLRDLDLFWGPRYPTWKEWSIVYLAGGEASHWYNEHNDLDILIGVDYTKLGNRVPALKGLSHAVISARFNAEFKVGLNSSNYRYSGSTWDRTFYVNPDSYDIRRIKPYAAYDLSGDKWAVRPVEAGPTWGPQNINPAVWHMVEHAIAHVRHIINDLSGWARQRQAKEYYEYLHTDRTRAFGPYGDGLTDRGNVILKALDMHPDHLLERLIAASRGSDQLGKTAGKVLRRKIRDDKAGDKYTGCMIALVPDEDLCKLLALPGGEKPEVMHITLAYMPDVKEVPSLHIAIEEWAKKQEQPKYSFNGYGVFNAPEEQVLWASFDVPGLPDIRQELVHLIVDHGIKVATNHGFTPHCTLKYDKKINELPERNPGIGVGESYFTHVWVCEGPEWVGYPLGGGPLTHPTAKLADLEQRTGLTYHHIGPNGQETPPLSQEEIYNRHGGQDENVPIYEHQLRHHGKPVARLQYQVDGYEPTYLGVQGMATHKNYRGAGHATALQLRLQRQAQAHGQTIYHGDRTPHGHAWWQSFKQHPEFDPKAHDMEEPTPRYNPEEVYKDAFPHESKKEAVVRVPFPAQDDPDWDHYYGQGADDILA